MALKVAVAGASGYSGAELVRILMRHPRVQLALLCGDKTAGERFDSLYPAARGFVDHVLEPMDEAAIAKKAQLVFLALPHVQAMKIVPGLLEKGLKVVDLSGDFRLKDPIVFEKWYKAPHTAPQLLKEAVYGLPEMNRAAIAKARLVANPGCYATSVILALLPLLKEKAVDPASLVLDSKSGVSGAGRKAALYLNLSEAGENFSAYRVGTHQHIPEMEQALSIAAGKEIVITFTPHLLPVVRGILTTAYADLSKEGFSTKKLQSLYRKFYQAEPFVRVFEGEGLPDLRGVKGSNFCDLGVRADERTQRAIVVSCIDNLGKGAAGQAIQNMNLMQGFPEKMGLDYPAFAP